MNQIEQVEAAHGPAYQTIAKGTAYYASKDVLGRWCVSSHRLALGRSNVGTCRFFADLADIEKTIKAFAGLALLAGAEGTAQ